MKEPPFEVKNELYCKLCTTLNPLSIHRRPTSTPPKIQINKSPAEKNYLPGQPRVALQGGDIRSYLESDLITRDLNKLAPYLWLIAKQDSSHISSLTHQIVRGRSIIVTEKPELHLVWIYDRVFIKPIPKYLLSHAFWEFYLTREDSPVPVPLRQDIIKAALGFLRSYAYLIRHKSDFVLATDDKHRLLPKNISSSDFIKFITAFEDIKDEDVCPRYRFGELRLTRLNFWSKIFLRRFAYQKVHGQYGAYFAGFCGPLLFIFGIFSVLLSAMQVVLAVRPIIQSGHSWITFAHVSPLVAVFPLSVLVFLQLREIAYAIKDLYRSRTWKSRQDVERYVSLHTTNG
ncbi:hypothetical protein AOQ84DRAFT_397119 [Glonium stellatum]|uniref:Uncharacterized protein n=1 Tax=Glonium stellatum TaxID=574774 RepID=A0A8E2JUC6_9PEZI|nr:hypothetical protein AOQ84DRAFT_397119 [Glonium stellatum]